MWHVPIGWSLSSLNFFFLEPFSQLKIRTLNVNKEKRGSKKKIMKKRESRPFVFQNF